MLTQLLVAGVALVIAGIIVKVWADGSAEAHGAARQINDADWVSRHAPR